MAEASVRAAVEQLRGLPAVTGAQIGVIGFSLGTYWALRLSQQRPTTSARAAYLDRFAEHGEARPALV